MDIFEKFFQLSWKKLNLKKSENAFDDDVQWYQNYLTIFSSYVLETDAFSILPSLRFVGFDGNAYYLPAKIKNNSDPPMARKIYLHLTLLSSAYYKLKISIEPLDHVIQDRLNFLNSIGEINSYLDTLFPDFLQLQTQVFEHACKFHSEESSAFRFWQQHFLSRSREKTNFISNEKSNGQIPEFLFYTVPAIAKINKNQKALGNEKHAQSRQDKKKPLEKNIHDRPEEIRLEDKECNPLMHSFEKIETTDEYTGNRKINSDQDDLDDHSDSLSEVQFGKFTRDGNSKTALFQAHDLSQNFSHAESEPRKELLNFKYPEWSSVESRYIANYCNIKTEYVSGKTDKFEKFAAIKNAHSTKIKYWRSKITELQHRPIWKKKLAQGTEVHLDEATRELTEIKFGIVPKELWYTQKRKTETDLAICILFDQSMSSDSWIANHRILDLTIESLALTGLLFQELLPQIQIAGTWSQTRHHCHYKIYKKFSDSWLHFFSQLESIEAEGYTRLGPAIRHATTELSQIKAEKKLLMLITDGKPTDIDGYEGVYGISDVKRACTEAEQKRITTVALAIDSQNRNHFAKMFTNFYLLNSTDGLYEELWRILIKTSQPR